MKQSNVRTCVSRVFVVLAFAGIAACGGSDRDSPVAGDCSSLKNFSGSIGTTITASESIDASATAPWQVPGDQIAPTSTATVSVPFCRVQGVVRPTEQSNIAFEVWLPADKAAWNERFFGTASGGSAGRISRGSLVDPLTRGYAAVAHDNGHTSTNFFEQSWAFDAATRTVRIEPITDFGYRAQHSVTVVGKEIVAAYYASEPARAYYNGCSQGGHHGMMEVQRYPDDYDAVIAGAHGGDWSGMMSSEAHAAISTVKNDRAGGLTTVQQLAVNAAALAACDANDGLADGLIQNPAGCQFDPAVVQCGAPGADASSCLSPAQVEATRAIYAGPRRNDGSTVSPGYSVGSEVLWSQTWNSTTELRSGSYYDFYRLILKQDPDFDFLTIDFDTDVDAGRAKYGHIYDAVDPDLSAFKARGGKLIMYHGWADPLIAAELSVDSWKRIEQQMGATAVEEFARLFMIPGMGHCSGGPNATPGIDWLTAMENWAENGIAPDATTPANTIVGSGTEAGTNAPRTRPICPYPSQHRYDGTGDINSAQSFTCEKWPSPVGS